VPVPFAPAHLFPLYLAGPVRQSLSRYPRARSFSLSALWACAVSSTLPAPAVDQRARTHALCRDPRPRRLPTCPSSLFEPRPSPHSLPHLNSHSPALAHAAHLAGDPRPPPRPSSSPETVPSHPELRPEVRHPCPCSVSPILLCCRPISASPEFGRGGPSRPRGDRPI
jgi:hypothetical protein